MPLPADLNVKDADGLTVAVKAPLTPGRASAAESRPVALSNEDFAVLDGLEPQLGIVTEAAPGTDTASSGLNGRLQRIAQRLTTAIANIGSSADAILTAGNAGSLASYMRTIMEQTLSAAASAVDLTKIGGNTIATGNGVVGTGVIRTTQASDSPIVAALGTAGTAKTYTGSFVVAGSTLTRPANTTPYVANDSISDNATAGSVTAKTTNNLSDTNDHPIDIAEILLDTTDTGPGAAAIQIRCHLFNSDPTASSGVVGGDNAAWSNKKAGWIGSFSGTMRAFSDGSRGVLVADEGTLRMIAPVSGAKNLYYQLQALGGFTPSANSTTFIPTFKGFQARPA